MQSVDFYLGEIARILKGATEGPVIAEFNNLRDARFGIFYTEANGKTFHFTLRPKISHYKVRFETLEGFVDCIKRNASLFDRGFISIAYINKKPVVLNPQNDDKTQKRRPK